MEFFGASRRKLDLWPLRSNTTTPSLHLFPSTDAVIAQTVRRFLDGTSDSTYYWIFLSVRLVCIVLNQSINILTNSTLS